MQVNMLYKNCLLFGWVLFNWTFLIMYLVSYYKGKEVYMPIFNTLELKRNEQLHGWKFSVLIRNSVFSVFSGVIFPKRVNPVSFSGGGGYPIIHHQHRDPLKIEDKTKLNYWFSNFVL